MVDPREAYSIKKFVNRLIHNYSGSDWENKISLQELRRIDYELTQMTASDIFNKMKILRDKYFAHLDISRKNFEVEWTPKEITELSFKCEQILNDLSLPIFGFQTWYEFSPQVIGNHVFEDLLMFNILQEEVMEAYKQPNSSIKTETIYYWLYHKGKLKFDDLD